MKIKELMKENQELKHQIKLYKQTSQSTLTPQKSIETLPIPSPKDSPFVQNLFAKKPKRKMKKKTKRRKVEYLNAEKVSLDTSFILIICTIDSSQENE